MLDAVHTTGGTSWTLESFVADLTTGDVYIYYFYQYDKPVVLNVAEEIAKKRAPGPLSKLFPEDVQKEAARRYQRARANQMQCSPIGKTWLGLVLGSLVLLIVFSIKNRRGWIFWLPVVIILGPLGLIVWLAAGHRQKISSLQAVLIEGTGDVLPSVLSFMVLFLSIVLFPTSPPGVLIQLLCILVFPFLLGWLVFQSPWLSLASHKSFLSTLWKRLPTAWVAANLGMAGVNAFATILVNLIFRTCSLMSRSPWIGMSIWAAVVAGAVVAILLLMLYEGLAVRGGLQGWSVLAGSDGEVTTPSWRKLWWWIILSYVVLFGGIILNQVVQRLLSG